MNPIILLSLLPQGLARAPEAPAPTLSSAEQRAHDGLLRQFRTLTSPVAAAAAGELDLTEPGGVCLTPLVAALKDNWDLFDADERAEMTAELAPWKVDLLDPMLPPVSGDGVAPPAAAPCFGNYGANIIGGDRFSVEWDGGINEATAQAFYDALEVSWDVEIDEIGWKQPSGTSSYPLLVYVQSGGGAGAYTTVEYCSGVGYVPYIVAGSQSFSAGSWYQTMAAHEFNHASQFAYGFANEFWWWEATASYAEEDVFPTLNDWDDFTPYYGAYPYVGMNAFAGNSNDYLLFYHTYAMGIFGFHLDEYYGGPDAVISAWEEADHSNGQYDYWIVDAIDDTGLDFLEVYAHFLANNTVMDYEEGHLFGDVEIEEELDSVPVSVESGRNAPQSLGANFWKVDSDAGDDGDLLEISFTGDDSVDWIVVLVRASSSGVDEWIALDVKDGVGTGSLAFDGGSDLYVVASPMDEDAQGYYYDWTDADTYDYSFDLTIAEPVASGDDGDTGVGGDTGPSITTLGGDDDVIGFCACATGPDGELSDGALGLLGLAGLVSLLRRRRG